MTGQIIALLGTPVGALSIVMVAEGLALFVTSHFGTPQRYQVVVLASIPAITGIIYLVPDSIRDKLAKKKQARDLDPETIVIYQLVDTWGPSLDILHELVSLAEQRLEASQDALHKEMQGARSIFYDLIGIGYKCIQTARSIHLLCSNGYPDQALSLCRGLMEQEAYLWFIRSVDDPEELFQRYLDWENAKFYLRIKRQKSNLDARGIGPTAEEWENLTREYKSLKEKYQDAGNLKHLMDWAIGTREGGKKTIKATSVAQMIRKSEVEPTI